MIPFTLTCQRLVAWEEHDTDVLALMGYRKEPLFVASLNKTLALSRSSLLSIMSVAAQAGVAG